MNRSGIVQKGLRALLGVFLLSGLPAEAQRQMPHHHLEGVQVGNPAVGKRLFQRKGCVTCHAIKGQGGTVGPDLGKIQHTHNVYQMAASMWNHATQMTRTMLEQGIKRPEFKGDEMAHLLAYLHSLEVLGDPERGKLVFAQKGCLKCHSINGEGGKIGPELARTTHPHPPVELAGAMWNHSPVMSAMMEGMRIPRPTFDGNEMADLLAYLDAVQREAARGGATGAPHHPR